MIVTASSLKPDKLQSEVTQAPTTRPYVGPRPFERTEDYLFFGRDREARDLISLIIANRAFVLYSPSGAGKSSLLNTKVTLGLEKEGCWVFPTSRVQGQIPAKVTDAEIRNIFSLNAILSVRAAVPHLKVNDRYDGTISAFVESVLSTRSDPDEPLVWSFDQFEELFSFYEHRWTERTVFVQELVEALEKFSEFKVVLSVREDYIAKLDAYSGYFPNRLRARFRLERLQERAAIEAVIRPAESSGRHYDNGVPQAIVRELLETHSRDLHGNWVTVKGEFVEPVQLQVVCLNLWDSLPTGETLITERQLGTSGSVDEALRKFYEAAITDIVKMKLVSETSLRRWFEDALITSAGTRGTVYRDTSTTAGMPNGVVDLLVDRHIIRGDWRAGAQWYEITHDRLLRPIQESNRVRLWDVNWRRLRLIGLFATLAVALLLLPSLGFGVYSWNQQQITDVNNNIAWAETNFRDYPDVGAVSAMAATLGQKNILWGKPSVDPTNILANIAATLPENTISSKLKPADGSVGFFLSGQKRFVFWNSAEGVEIVSWDGTRSKITLTDLVGKDQSSSRVVLENVAEGAGDTVLFRLSVGSERQIVEVLRDGKVLPYGKEFFFDMSNHVKLNAQSRSSVGRLYSDRGVAYLFNNHGGSLVAEAFFMSDSNGLEWTRGSGWINYKDEESVINSLSSFPPGIMMLMVYSVVPVGQLKNILAFDLRHQGNEEIWSLTRLKAKPDDQSAVSGCLNKPAKNGCIFTGQDHGSSGLFAIQVPENQPGARVRDIAERALKLAHLVVVDVITGKTNGVGWDSVLASAKGAALGPEGYPSASQITNNLSVGGTIESLIVTVPNGRVFDVFSIEANVASYVGTYSASGLNGVLYFSDDRGKMILINGHEAKIWDISKKIKDNTKSLEEKKLNYLIQLACQIVPREDVLKEDWNQSGRRDELPRIPCGEPH